MRHSKDNDYWIWTASGKQFSFTHPEPEQVCIEDIACALSKTCRYGGQINTLYSVADHCVNVAQYIKDTYYKVPPKVLLAALLHDAAEAYVADVPSPAKRLLKDYQVLEDRVQSVIDTKYDVLMPERWNSIIKMVDNLIVRDEAPLLFDNFPFWINQFRKLDADIVISKSHQAAYNRFYYTFKELQERIQSEDN